MTNSNDKSDERKPAKLEIKKAERPLRMYEPIWKTLKAEGSVTLKLESGGIMSDIDSKVRRIKKAITKEKDMDKEFRVLNPKTRCKFEVISFKGTNYLKVKLTGYLLQGNPL